MLVTKYDTVMAQLDTEMKQYVGIIQPQDFTKRKFDIKVCQDDGRKGHCDSTARHGDNTVISKQGPKMAQQHTMMAQEGIMMALNDTKTSENSNIMSQSGIMVQQGTGNVEIRDSDGKLGPCDDRKGH